MTPNAPIKAAREAIDNKEFNTAIYYCDTALAKECTVQNRYVLLVFKAVASGHLDQPNDAIRCYREAGQLQPDAPLAWQGLMSLLDKIPGSSELMAEAAEKLFCIFNQTKDAAKSFEMLTKLKEIYAGNVQKTRYLCEWEASAEALGLYSDLPNAMSAKDLLVRLAEIKEQEEAAKIAAEVEKRRFRLDAEPLPILKAKVELEVIQDSDLEKDYERIIQFFGESEKGKTFVEKLLIRLYKKIPALSDGKETMVSQLRDICRLWKDRIPLAADIFYEFVDVASIDELQAIGLDEPVDNPDSLVASFCKIWRLKDDSAIDLLQEISSIRRTICRLESNYGVGYPKMKRFLSRLEGMAHFKTGQYEAARPLLEHEYALCPKDEAIIDALALLYIEVDEHAKAIELMKVQLESQPHDKAILSNIGKQYFYLRDLAHAQSYFDQALRQDSQFVPALAGLGQALWELGGQASRRDKSQCLSLFLTAVKADQKNATSFLYLGHYYGQVESDQARAEKCYFKALQLDSDLVSAAVELAKIWLTKNQRESVLQKHTAAKQVALMLQEFGSSNLRNSNLWKYLGIAYSWLDERQKAILAFQTALKGDLFEDEQVVLQLLAAAYFCDAKYVAACKAYSRALALDPSSIGAKIGLARTNNTLGNYADSISQLGKVLEEIEDEMAVGIRIVSGQTRLAYSKELINSCRYADAISSLELAVADLESCLQTFLGWSTLGRVAMELARGNFANGPKSETTVRIAKNIIGLHVDASELTKHVDKALGNETSCRWVRLGALSFGVALSFAKSSSLKSVCWTGLGQALFQRLHVQPALLDLIIECCQQALVHNHHYAPAWNLLGVVSFRTGDYAMAQHALIQAVTESGQRDATYWVNLGAIYFSVGDTELAERALERALMNNVETARAWYGQACIALGSVSCDQNRVLDLLGQAVECADASQAVIINWEFAWRGWSSENTEKQYSLLELALTRVVQLEPSNVSARNMLACVLERQGKVDQAYQELSQLNSDDARNLANLNRLALFAGRPAEPVDEYQKILALQSKTRLAKWLESERNELFRQHGMVELAKLYARENDLESVLVLHAQDPTSISLLTVLVALAQDAQKPALMTQLSEMVRASSSPEPVACLLLATCHEPSIIDLYKQCLERHPKSQQLWDGLQALAAKDEALKRSLVAWIEGTVAMLPRGRPTPEEVGVLLDRFQPNKSVSI